MNKILYGWLLPNSEFVECPMYCHNDIRYHNYIKDRLGDWMEERRSWLDELHEESIDLINQGEHPAWHVVEMAEDDYRWELMQRIHRIGCLRVGSINDSLYFSGTPKAWSRLKKGAEDLALINGFSEARFEKVNV